MRRNWKLALVVVIAAACRSTAPPPTPAGAATAAPVAVGAPAPVPEAIRWVRGSAEHRALFVEVYRDATAHVESEAARRAPGTWTVVLDADETVIDNSAYQLERARAGLPYDGASWRAWTVKREAPPLPGAAAFLARVRALGGKVVIVTNRSQAECPDTEADFREHGLAYDAMLCKPQGASGDKNPRFEAVAKGTTGAGLPALEIVAFLGDNVLDFPAQSQAIEKQGDGAFAAFGVRFFVLPNPMYGSWN